LILQLFHFLRGRKNRAHAQGKFDGRRKQAALASTAFGFHVPGRLRPKHEFQRSTIAMRMASRSSLSIRLASRTILSRSGRFFQTICLTSIA
jgi:hypothetical protein